MAVAVDFPNCYSLEIHAESEEGPVICGKITNLDEFMNACVKNQKIATKNGTETQIPKLRLITCRRKAVFAAKIGHKWHGYCASCFLRMWMPADISEKVKLL